MNLVDKIFLRLLTKSTGKIVSKDGHFELQLPSGFRYKRSGRMYQVFNLSDPSFLFQITGFAVTENKLNEFNIDNELANDLKKNPNVVAQSTGTYDCICSATVTEDGRLRTYSWKTGERNKRILVTVLLRDIEPGAVKEKILIVKNLLSGLIIQHII